MRAAVIFCACAAAAAAALPPPFGAIVTATLYKNPAVALRHCNYVASFTPNDGSDDFRFKIVPARNGAPAPAASLQSVNFPSMYFAPTGAGLALGISATASAGDASFTIAPGAANATAAFSLVSLSATPAFAGKYVTWSPANAAPCHYAPPAGDAVLAAATDAAASTVYLGAPPPPPPLPPATVNVTAVATHRVSPLFNGCHVRLRRTTPARGARNYSPNKPLYPISTARPTTPNQKIDPGYTQQPRGWFAQLVYGESFEKGTTAANGYAWTPFGAGAGTAALDAATPFNGAPSLGLTLSSGGPLGWANRGIGNEGMSLAGGALYEGYLFVLAPAGATLWLAANDYVANTVIASASVAVAAAPDWQRVAFSLSPTAGTACVGIAPGSEPNIDCGNLGPNPGHVCVKCAGELQVGLAQPGAAHVSFVYFAPGPWGRVAGQPVLKAAADTMAAMGITVIRQGGTVSQSFRWKDWRGVPWQRPSMGHVWGDSLVSGWGPFEFIDFANSAGIKPILTLAYDSNNASDWADLVEYLYADDSFPWGAMRIHTDGHPAPYDCNTWELGNEQENPDFVAQVLAMEARIKAVGAPKFTFLYPTNQGVSAATAAALVAGGVEPAAVAPDCHVGDGGGVGCARGDLDRIPGFNQSFINCEVNAGRSTLVRAMTEAADMQEWFNYGGAQGEEPSRLLARTASFCTERSGHYDAFDQGLSFFLPNGTWLQPPGYVHQMVRDALAPQAVGIASTPQYPASAQLSDAGDALTIQIVNNRPSAGVVTFRVASFSPSGAANVTTLNGTDLNAGNTPAAPTAMAPWSAPAAWAGGALTLTLPGFSFTTIVTPGTAA